MKAFYCVGSHWDREWYEPFQEFRMWLVELIDELMDLIEKNPPKNIWIDTIILKDGKIALRVLGDTQKIIEDYRKLGQMMNEVESAKVRKIGAPFRKEVKRQVFEALIDVVPKQK